MTASDGEKARVYVKTSEVALGATRNGEQQREGGGGGGGGGRTGATLDPNASVSKIL